LVRSLLLLLELLVLLSLVLLELRVECPALGLRRLSHFGNLLLLRVEALESTRVPGRLDVAALKFLVLGLLSVIEGVRLQMMRHPLHERLAASAFQRRRSEDLLRRNGTTA